MWDVGHLAPCFQSLQPQEGTWVCVWHDHGVFLNSGHPASTNLASYIPLDLAIAYLLIAKLYTTKILHSTIN